MKKPFKILRLEIAKYENGFPSGSYRVFVPGDKGAKEKFWGFMPVEWVEALNEFQRLTSAQ